LGKWALWLLPTMAISLRMRRRLSGVLPCQEDERRRHFDEVTHLGHCRSGTVSRACPNVNSNYKTLHTSLLLGKDSGLLELFESLPDKSSE
jgi:hypothetical protein